MTHPTADSGSHVRAYVADQGRDGAATFRGRCAPGILPRVPVEGTYSERALFPGAVMPPRAVVDPHVDPMSLDALDLMMLRRTTAGLIRACRSSI